MRKFSWLCLKCWCNELSEEENLGVKISVSSGIDKCSICCKRKSVHQAIYLSEEEIEEKQKLILKFKKPL